MRRALIFIFLLSFLGIVLFVVAKSLSPKPLDLHSPLITLQNIMTGGTQRTYIVYGYLPYWTSKTAKLPSALTNLSFFSLPIHADGRLLPDDEVWETGEKQVDTGILENLRLKAPHAALELTLTMMDQDDIEMFLATPSATPTFLSQLDKLLAKHKLTGINLDVEYVREADETARARFTNFASQIRKHLDRNHPTLSFSIAVLADAASRPRLTDIKALVPFVDHFVIMAYDYVRRASPQSGANAPLYGEAQEKWGKNIMHSVKAYTEIVPAQKLILGVPFYGYEWSVTSTDVYNHTIPQSGKTAIYERIKSLIDSGKAVRYFDQNSLTPYVLYTQNGKQQQIYYEDSQSLAYKLELVRQAGLAGIAIWALGYEGDSNELWETIGTLNTSN